MAYDASNRRDVRTAQKLAKVAEQQRKEIMNGIMSVTPGRKWMCELLETCHIFATSFSDSQLRMAFMEGQREIGLRMLSDIMAACPDQYVEMMRERNARSSTDESRFQRRPEDTDGRDSNTNTDDESDGDDAANYDNDGRAGQPNQ